MSFGSFSFKKRSNHFILLIGLFFLSFSSFATEVPIYDFSIKPYSQNINDYLSSDGVDYDNPLLKPEYQKAQLHQFYNHYYSSSINGLSPWSETMIQSVIPKIKKIELELLNEFDNQNKLDAERHYAENFKEHDNVWFNQIKRNMNLTDMDALVFNEQNRAISITNTFARALPEHAPDFFHFSMPGQGFPFDNLQESVIWAGTPLYVLSTSQDKAWSLVLTPDAYFAWVKSSDVAFASNAFISRWQKAVKKGLVAITETGVSITNKYQHFQFAGYIGAVFPSVARDDDTVSILIPVKNAHHIAEIQTGLVSARSASLMPLAASKRNMARIIKQLQNRPYGWGGAFFFNDCSQELKSIFTPLGIWLPRNSAQQAKIGTGIDLTKNNVDERINALKSQGHPLMTLIYIGGHVMLYLGNKSINNHELAAITYQNVWGLSPENKDKRYIIGQSLFFPLLKYYPENPDISSLANKSYFTLIHLDELSTKSTTPKEFVNSFSQFSHPDLSL